MHGSKLTAFALGAASLLAAVPATAAAQPVTVCNEAENSHRGGYEVTGGPVDPVPPAFLRGSQMKVGSGAGVENAAFHSPALRLCGPEGSGGGGGDPTDPPTDPTDPPTDPTDPPTDPTDPPTDPTDPPTDPTDPPTDPTDPPFPPEGGGEGEV